MTASTPPVRRSSRYLKFAVLVVVAACAVLLSRFVDLREAISSALEWIEDRGMLGAAVFVVLYITATILAFPASLLTLGAGAVYGFWIGFALVSAGSTLGATAAFLIARYIAREWVAARIAGNPRFRALDQGVAVEGWKLVFLTRLSPLFPFNLQNYGYGLTRVPALHYALASWVGMIPGTMMYVYFGHIAGSVAAAGANREKSPTQWVLLGLGLVATIAVTIVATRIARRSLAKVSSIESATSA